MADICSYCGLDLLDNDDEKIIITPYGKYHKSCYREMLIDRQLAKSRIKIPIEGQ